MWSLCCVVTPAEKILDFIQMMGKFAHLDYLKLITFLLESSHLARSIATAFFRDATPLQMTQHYSPETKMQNFFKSSWTKNELLFQITYINRIVVKFGFGKLSKTDSVNAFFSP